MVYTVYIDVVFFTNTLMDLAILLMVARVLSFPIRLSRVLAAAGIGGIWACVAALIPDMPLWLEAFMTYVGVSACMAVTAFGFSGIRAFVHTVASMYIASLFLGGVMLMIWENMNVESYFRRVLGGGPEGRVSLLFWIFMACGTVSGGIGLAGLLRQYVKRVAQREDLCRVTLRYREQTETVTGLIDTGNRLVEPVTGRPVHVAEEGLMRRLCPVVDGIIYVPFHSVGSSGVLPALFVDEIEVEQKGERYCLKRPLVAVSCRPLSPSKDYQILIQKTDEGIHNRRTFP